MTLYRNIFSVIHYQKSEGETERNLFYGRFVQLAASLSYFVEFGQFLVWMETICVECVKQHTDYELFRSKPVSIVMEFEGL